MLPVGLKIVKNILSAAEIGLIKKPLQAKIICYFLRRKKLSQDRNSSTRHQYLSDGIKITMACIHSHHNGGSLALFYMHVWQLN